MRSKFLMLIAFLTMNLQTHLEAAEAKLLDKNEVIKTLGLVEGHYDTMVAKSSFKEGRICQDEELDIELVQNNGGELTLTLGPVLNFPNLEKKEMTDVESPTCSVKFVTALSKNKLNQKVTRTCGKSVQEKTHILEFNKNEVKYTFIKDRKKQSCVYSLILARGSKK